METSELLQECKIQLEYLNEKFGQTGTTNALLAKIDKKLNRLEMKPLTPEQIKSVISWMNTWEQLKNTAIPLRFKEDFSNEYKGNTSTIENFYFYE